VTRRHARRLEVVVERRDDGHLLKSPAVGLFWPTSSRSLASGASVGTLEILGTAYELTIPRGLSGLLEPLRREAAPDSLDPQFVSYGSALGVLSPWGSRLGSGSNASVEPTDDPATMPDHQHVFRAPTSGRYYGRSAPDKPPFVVPGAELVAGGTVCLLEVMKTFNRVTYDGDPCRVREVLVADGADVNAGDPLVALDPI